MIGATFSQDIYREFEETKRQNIFEEVIDQMMVDNYLPEEFKDKIKELPLESKRRAIFTFIDENSHFVLNELDKLPEDAKLIDKFRTALQGLKKYIEVGQQEVKKFGEVFTPLELVEEMLDTLPKEIWSNPELKWGDTSSGMGNFPLIVIKRLMVGLKSWESDPNKRYKHIMENMIYVCELQPRNAFMYLYLVDPHDTYDINLYCGSFLDEGFDKHMKNVWNIEKIDIIVGNPPYNQSIDLKFMEKSYHISDQVLFVHPSTWLIDEKNKQRKFIKAKDLIKDDLKSIKLFNGNGIFNISLFVTCSITYIDKKHDGKIKLYDKINNSNIEYDDINEINKYNTEEYLSIKSKVEKYPNNLWENKYNEGLYYVNLSQIRGNVNIGNGNDMLKDDFYTMITRDEKTSTTKDKHLYFGFDNKVESDNFIKYIKTKFSRFCLSIYKNNSQLCRGELEIVPWLDFTQEWTDDKLREKFNITDKEWEFIDSVIPNYY